MRHTTVGGVLQLPASGFKKAGIVDDYNVFYS